MYTQSFISAELTHVMPVSIKESDVFKIQIRSDHDGGRSTKWINITAEQFMMIEQVLYGLKNIGV
jgi:hypothetical protein